MVLNIRIIWVPAAVIIVSIIMYVIINYVPSIPLTAKIIFWLGLVVLGYFAFLEMLALTKNFIHEHFRTPKKKAQEYLDMINSQREKIENFLNYEIDGQSTDELREHYYDLEEAEFSKEALAPYIIKWYNHIDYVHELIQKDERAIELENFQKEKEQIQQEIEELEKERDQKLGSEEEQLLTKREEFLEEYKDKLHIDATDLSEEEKRWLEEEGYQRSHQWCIVNKQSVEFMVRPRSNESVSHAYLTSAIYKYIKEDGLDPEAQLYETKMPDIVFNYGGFQWAIEIETGNVHKKSKKQLQEKVNMLNEKFEGRWFFVVTNKNLLSKYRKFGDTVDRSNVIEKVDGIFYHDGYPEPEL